MGEEDLDKKWTEEDQECEEDGRKQMEDEDSSNKAEDLKNRDLQMFRGSY